MICLLQKELVETGISCDMIIYSIIIPHKNIPKLLQRCLDSIPQRPDLEVIVVDDDSDPDIVDFEQFPGKKRSDTTVIFDKSGKGAGRARNIGLEHAQGKWLLFADADDFFTYCLNDVLDEYVDCESDIVFFRASSVDCELYTNSDRADVFINCYIQKYFEERHTGEMLLRYVAGCPWGKLVRHSIVIEHQICFQETAIYNDTKFSYLAGYYAKSIAVDMRAVYCLTQRADSITYTLTDEKILDRVRVVAEREQFYLKHNIFYKGGFWMSINELIALKEQGKFSLYDKCLGAFSEFGFSHEAIEKMIVDELLRRKKVKRRRNINRRLSKVKRTGGKLLRFLLCY